jgi:hypothetical protein
VIFSDLRKYVSLVTKFAAIEAPITEASGLRQALDWALEAADAFGIPEATSTLLRSCRDDENRFELLLATIRFAYSLKPDLAQGEGDPEDRLVSMENGDVVHITEDGEQFKIDALAMQLVAFTAEFRRSFLPVA